MIRAESPARSDEIRTEAAAWLARLHVDDCPEIDKRAFQIWLAADPAHTEAFEAVDALWESAAGLPRDMRGYEETRPPPVTRRAVLAGLGTLIVVGGSISFWKTADAKIYQTDIGEQKHVVLADGSYIFLDTNTRVTVDFNGRERSADLQYGRANFRVMGDEERPFVVSAAERKILTTQSSFDICREGDQISIVLIKGQAMIEDANGAETQTKILGAGERLIAAAGQIVKLDRPNLGPLLAWQTGQAIFENEKLSSAIDEMNRYSTIKMEIANPAIADFRVSGVYNVGDNAAFASSVQKLLPIKVRQWDGQVYLDIDAARLRG